MTYEYSDRSNVVTHEKRSGVVLVQTHDEEARIHKSIITKEPSYESKSIEPRWPRQGVAKAQEMGREVVGWICETADRRTWLIEVLLRPGMRLWSKYIGKAVPPR